MPVAEAERTNLISADIVGPRMSAETLYTLHDFTETISDRLVPVLSEGGIFDGVEAFPVMPIYRFDRFAGNMKDMGFPVMSIHGRTGGTGAGMKDSAMLFACNASLLDTPSLINRYGDSYDVLFHVPELKNPRNTDALRARGDRIKYVWVENHHGHPSMDDAVATVRELRSAGIPSGVMFDICHYIGAENLINGLFLAQYKRMLEATARYLDIRDGYGRQIVEGIHFPVGRKKTDSLPIDTMHDDLLRDFAAVINDRGIRRLVIEHQEEGLLYLIRFPKALVETLRKRYESITDRLLRTNVL